MLQNRESVDYIKRVEYVLFSFYRKEIFRG